MGLFSWLFGDYASTAKALDSGYQAVGGVIGGGEPRPFTLPAKSPAQHETVADALDYLCKQWGATYEREVKGVTINVKLLLPNGEVRVGSAESTAAAVAQLVEKMGGEK